MIWGSAGLIVAFAKKYKISGSCIMGETGLLDVDANAAKAVLEVLVKHLNLSVNLDNIDKIRKETEKMLHALDEATKKEEQGANREDITYIR
jgi:proteasome assembly chaperone (PAC2) family protein